MSHTRRKKIIGDVMARKSRTLLVSAAIFIGMAGTVALFSMSDALINQLEQDVDEGKLAMAQVQVNANPGATFDNAAYLNQLSQNDDVVVGGVEDETVYFKLAANDEAFEEGAIQAYEVLDEAGQLTSVFGDEAPIEPLRLKTGSFPTEGANEVVIEQRMADKYDLKAGDTLLLRVLSPSHQPEQNGAAGTTEVWTISGVVFDAYAGLTDPQAALYARVDDAAYLVGVPGYTDLWFRFKDFPTAENQIDHVVNWIATETPYTPVGSVIEDPAQSSLLEGAQMIGNLMRFLAITALLVSGFLVINVISTIVMEQKRQIGVMKALGATRFDHTVIYAGMALMYGILGVIPGVIVGVPAGNALAHALAPEINTVLEGFQISLPAILIGIVLGLLVPVLAALPPVFNATRIRILDAMTDLGIDATYGKGRLPRLIKRLPLPVTVRQGLSNLTLKKARMTFTVITLALAVGAFMGIFSVFSQLTRTLDQFRASYNVQAAIMPFEARNPDEIKNLIATHFGDVVQAVEPGVQLEVEFEGYEPQAFAGSTGQITAYGYDIEGNDPVFRFDLQAGNLISSDNAARGIIVSSKLADSMHKQAGDQVTMHVPGASAELEIVGIVEYPFDQAWLQWETLARLSGYEAGGVVYPQMYFIHTTDSGATADDVNHVLSEVNEVFAQAGIPVLAINFVQIIDEVTQRYT
ncbi:MAG TPA: ABC transporter permease, partial [Aggregatilineaceae bacterium]|nr:ABC transporter permease [Aggregatilineaceae bacterium]